MKTANEPKRRVIGLIRVSTEEQAKEDRGGIPRQKAAIRQACERFHLELVHEVELVDVSGRHTRDDPQFQQLERDMQRPDIQGVAVVNVDRIYRPENYSDFSVLDVFKKNRRLIWTANEQIDPNTQSGWFTLIVGGAVAGNELHKLRERCEETKEQGRHLGRHCNGRKTLARGVLYDKATRKWSYDPEVTPQILRAYDLMFAGNSYREIARRLGSDWGWKQIFYSLRNPIWMGVQRYEFKEDGPERVSKLTGKHYREKVRRLEPILVKVIDPPLISPETWQRAQQVLAERRTCWMTGREPKNNTPLLNGLLRCACGRSWYGNYKKSDHLYYFCGSRRVSELKNSRQQYCGARSYRGDLLEPVIERIVTDVLLDKGFLRQVFDGLKEAAEKPTKASLQRTREIDRLEAERKRLIHMHVTGRLLLEEFDERAQKIEERRLRLGPAPITLEQIPENPSKIILGIAKAFARFSLLALEDKRNLLKLAIREFVVEDGAIPKLTVNARFIEEMSGVKVCNGSRTVTQFHHPCSDLLIRLPEPVEILPVQ